MPWRTSSCTIRSAVEDRRLAEAGADDARRALQEAVGALFADLDGGRRLQQAHLLDDVQEQVGHLVDAVAAVGLQAAGVDLGEIGVGAALGGRDAHLGRGRLVVEFAPEALQELFGLLPRERAFRQPALVEGGQVLVQPARIEGVPGVQLDRHAQVDEPVVLQRLPEVARRLGWDVGTDRGDALQLHPALRIDLGRRQLARPLRVALAVADERLGTDAHGPQLLLLGPRLRIALVVEARQPLVDRGAEIVHAAGIDLVVENGMPRRALLHELGKDAGLVGGVPRGCHLAQDEVAHRAALPKGDDLVLIDRPRRGADGKGDLFPGIKDVQVSRRVAAELGVGRRRLGGRPLFSHDELALLDADSLVLQQVLEEEGPAYRGRHGAQVLLVEGRHQPGALGGKGGAGGEALLAQAGDAGG